jgi:hypothetical protein
MESRRKRKTLRYGLIEESPNKSAEGPQALAVRTPAVDKTAEAAAIVQTIVAGSGRTLSTEQTATLVQAIAQDLQQVARRRTRAGSRKSKP